MDIDLKAVMNSLETNGDYFYSIPSRAPLEYETDYHAVAIDPDGKTRNLLEEREASLLGCLDILHFVEKHKPGKVLDFGCGLGWLLSSIDISWEKHGLEISKFASEHASQFGQIFCGDYREYSESNFDLVIMNHVIEHLPDPLSSIKMAKQFLKPGAHLIIGTPNFDSGAARRYGGNFRMLHDPTHISLFSEDSLRRLLRDNGFKITNIEYPYFDTPWFNKEDLLKMFDKNQISPPFYGSFITIFAQLEIV